MGGLELHPSLSHLPRERGITARTDPTEQTGSCHQTQLSASGPGCQYGEGIMQGCLTRELPGDLRGSLLVSLLPPALSGFGPWGPAGPAPGAPMQTRIRKSGPPLGCWMASPGLQAQDPLSASPAPSRGRRHWPGLGYLRVGRRRGSTMTAHLPEVWLTGQRKQRTRVRNRDRANLTRGGCGVRVQGTKPGRRRPSTQAGPPSSSPPPQPPPCCLRRPRYPHSRPPLSAPRRRAGRAACPCPALQLEGRPLLMLPVTTA